MTKTKTFRLVVEHLKNKTFFFCYKRINNTFICCIRIFNYALSMLNCYIVEFNFHVCFIYFLPYKYDV